MRRLIFKENAVPPSRKKIEVIKYDTKWQELFQLEADLVKASLGKNCIDIHHIGSTSVPGLSAKPIIDILPVVKSIQNVDQVNDAIESLGYVAKGESGMAFRRFFQKPTHNVHVYQEGDPEISRYLKFRDWMRAHPDDAKKYATLKVELAKKFPHDILSYCNGKDAFVASIDAQNGYDGWRMVQALTEREWKAVHKLVNQNQISTGQDHIHFVFYNKAEVIGYAHLQLFSNSRAEIKSPIIDETFKPLFTKLCLRWIDHQHS